MSELVVDILEDFLGEPKKHYHSKSQIEFDCPACAEHGDGSGSDGVGKGNLAINYERGIYKCWSCKDVNNMYGRIPFLIKRYGTNKHLAEYRIHFPDDYVASNTDDDDIEKEIIIVKLPEEFIPLTPENRHREYFSKAMAYVQSRNLDKEIIKKFNIGYAYEGKYRFRVIIPSYDADGEINYFVARSWFDNSNQKYLNPDAEKLTLIFNENLINWDSTVYVVEGAFDHIVTPNSVPMLGKDFADKLLMSILDKAKGFVVFTLDPDAWKNTLVLYDMLYRTHLKKMVKAVQMSKKAEDIAKVHEKFGRKSVIKVLSAARVISEEELRESK